MGGGSMFGFKSPGWADHAPAHDEANRAICSTAIGVTCAHAANNGPSLQHAAVHERIVRYFEYSRSVFLIYTTE